MSTTDRTLSSAEYDLSRAVHPNRLIGLWRLSAGFRWPYLAATLSLALSATGRAAASLSLRYLVDTVLAESRFGVELARVVLAFFGAALLEAAFSYFSGIWAAHTGEGVARRLRNYLYDHIQRLSFAYHDHAQTGDLIERCSSDVDSVRRLYADQAIGIGRIVSLFIINMAALLRLNVPLAWLASAVLAPLFAVSVFFFRRVSSAYQAYQAQEARLSTVLQENLTGVRVVRAFARQDYEREKFDRENWAKFQRGRRLWTMHALYWPLSDALCGLQMLLCVWIGALRVVDGTITPGAYVAYSALVIGLVWPMRNLGRLIVNMSTGLVSYDRVREIMQQPREPLLEGDVAPSGPLRGALVFDDVSFHYQSGHEAISNVSFECAPSQTIALLGSTGSGKTTLANLLPRFHDYDSGHVLLDGVELKRYPRRYLRQQIGIVEQEPFLFSRTIRENITYGAGRPVTMEEVEAAARTAAIDHEIRCFPNGYETMLGERGITLSGGQKQRVAVARTLLKNPRILILDDSTSSVDAETEALIRSALDRLLVGRTTFIIAHRVQSLMNADLILVFDRGRVVQRGTHAELMTQPGPYRQIYDLQVRIESELEQELRFVRGSTSD
jgi:ATP-binding cassette subfamily B protein